MDNKFDDFNETGDYPQGEVKPEAERKEQSFDSFSSPAEEHPTDKPSTETPLSGFPGQFRFKSEDIIQDEPATRRETTGESEASNSGFDSYPETRRPQTPPPATQYRPGDGDFRTNYRNPGEQQVNRQPGAPQQPQHQPYNFGRPYSYNQPPQPPQKPKKSNKAGKIAVISIICVAVAVALVFIGGKLFGGTKIESGSELTQDQTTAAADGSNSDDTTAAVQLADVSSGEKLNAVQIADKCRSCVVGVMTYVNGQLEGEGSGVVMGFDSAKENTYIMTCAHVISTSGVTYGILTLDGTSYTAELVGYDSRTDIGVLKVKGTDFDVAEFADSTQLKIGETVYAIGNPGGSEYFGSMTEGIVSAIDRNVSGSYNITCIQHDAAINPGNSGGALVNSSGQVVGINSSKIADTDYEGMGFAVPSATATDIAKSLISYGYVPNRPKLGITYANVNSYQVYSMVVAIKGLPAGSLIITGISDDSAFKGTDAKEGDMIIAVNGKDMDSSDVLLDLIDKGAVGDSITLTLCRVNSRTYQTSNFDVTIKLVEDKGSSAETTTESDSIYDFGNGESSGGNNGGFDFGNFGFDFGDFFRQFGGQ